MVLFLKRHSINKQAKKFLTTPVGDLMTPYVVTTKANISVIQAATRMIAQDVSCIVVVDDQNKPVGIITERDFLKKVPANTSVVNKKVQDIMTQKVVTVTPQTTIEEAHLLMRKNKFRKLVVTENNVLQGVFTQTDIVRYALKTMKQGASEKAFVSSWMSKKIIFASVTSSFSQIKKLMVSHDIGAMLLKGKSFEGIFTEYDVVAQFYDQGGMLQIKSPKEIMHKHIRCIGDSANIFFANKVMNEKKIRRLLVLKDTQAVGIITQTDITDALIFCAKECSDKDFLSKQKEFFTLKKSPIESLFVTENFKLYS